MKISQATRLLFSNPALFRDKLKRNISGTPAPKSGDASTTLVKRTLEDRLAEASELDLRNIVVMGDQAFDEAARSLFGDRIRGRMDSNYMETRGGAELPRRIELDGLDGILLGGKQVKADYLLALRILEDSKVNLPLLWVAEDFEQCFGSMAFPARVDDADVYLYNHFEEFFGLRDSLLARIEIFDQNGGKSEWRLVKANETLHYNLKSALPERQGPAAITVHVTHPTLTRGRHYRWRFHGDLYLGNSIVSLHGCHDLRGTDAANEFRLAKAGFGPGEFVVTLPNYARDLPEGAKVLAVENSGRKEIARTGGNRVDEIRFPLDQSDYDSNDFSAVSYKGYGGSFWYGITALNNGDSMNIAGNHSCGTPIATPPKEETFAKAPLYGKLVSDCFVLWPHAVPITGPEDELEFGFTFDEAWPAFEEFRLLYFDRASRLLKEDSYTKDKAGAVFISDLPNVPAIAGLVVTAPKLESIQLSDAKKVKANGNLTVRHRRTGDFDLTEFQSCWRNIGANIPGFPHWIAPPLAYLGRTNLYGRVTGRKDLRSGLVLVNGSGSLAHNVTADIELRMFDVGGNVVFKRTDLAPFCQKVLWLDELFPNYYDFLGDGGPGALVIRCRNVDLNGQMVTIFRDHGVSLQHLWGY